MAVRCIDAYGNVFFLLCIQIKSVLINYAWQEEKTNINLRKM